jgi:hypothetical protein
VFEAERGLIMRDLMSLSIEKLSEMEICKGELSSEFGNGFHSLSVT